MFFIVAADQLHLRLCRPKQSESGLKSVVGEEPVNATPPEANSVNGSRYQLLRALRAMANGQFMLVAHKIPSLPDYVEDLHKQNEWFQSLNNVASWKNQNDIEPVLVPGTAYTSVIGQILIRAGWCAPCTQPHWMPTLRFFFLTDAGRESLKKAQAWWTELTTLERMRLMLME